MRDAEVRADGEAVRHATEQVDLPGVACLDEGFLGLVAELGGEDLVDLFGVVSRGDMYQMKGMNLPEAAMDKGPVIPPSSSWVTKEG